MARLKPLDKISIVAGLVIAIKLGYWVLAPDPKPQKVVEKNNIVLEEKIKPEPKKPKVLLKKETHNLPCSSLYGRGDEDKLLDALIVACDFPISYKSTPPRVLPDTTIEAERLCRVLYDNYGVKSILISGVREKDADLYRSDYDAKLEKRPDMWNSVFESNKKILKSRKWRLYPAEQAGILYDLDQLEFSMRDLLKQFNQEVTEQMKYIINDTKKWDGDDLSYSNEKVNEHINSFAPSMILSYNDHIKAAISDDLLKEIYDLAVTQRDEFCAGQIKKCKKNNETPIIVIIEGERAGTLKDHLSDMSYVVVRPYGNSGEPLVNPTPKILEKNYLIQPGEFAQVNLEATVGGEVRIKE